MQLGLVYQLHNLLVVEVLELREGELQSAVVHNVLDGDVKVRVGQHSVDPSLDEVLHSVTADFITCLFFKLLELLSRGALKLLIQFRSNLSDVVATVDQVFLQVLHQFKPSFFTKQVCTVFTLRGTDTTGFLNDTVEELKFGHGLNSVVAVFPELRGDDRGVLLKLVHLHD